jgi:hypothetical protein
VDVSAPARPQPRILSVADAAHPLPPLGRRASSPSPKPPRLLSLRPATAPSLVLRPVLLILPSGRHALMDAKEEAAWILEDEKEFSTVNIINTYLRNKMGDDWLNDLMICYVEKEIFAKIDDKKIMLRFHSTSRSSTSTISSSWHRYNLMV